MSSVAVVELDVGTEVENLKRQVREAKEAQKRREWEEKTKKRNQQYVVGSLRRGSGEDLASVGHNHGWVCEIVCKECGQKRIVNKQDAFQAIRCKDCQGKVRKAKRRSKKASEQIEVNEKEIKELQGLLMAIA